MGKNPLAGAARLSLHDQFDEAKKCALGDPARAAIARLALQAIIEGRDIAPPTAKEKAKPSPKRDRAEERRVVVEANYRRLGHNAVNVPRPSTSNHNVEDWDRSGLELNYRPADSELTYDAWMISHGQSKHWTVTDEDARKQIGWEPCAIGYWFLAEIAPACPKLSTSWNDLTSPASGIRLLSLEEYAIVYWTHRDITGLRIDVSTWCWLRTRYGLGALDASDYDGEIHVSRYGASSLAVPDDCGGGRGVVEVVLKPAA